MDMARFLCDRDRGRPFSRTALILTVLLLAGCGGKPAKVSGVVTLDGEPLTRGIVGFSPSVKGQKAVGIINSDGSYELSTNRDKGLEIGEYIATVVSRARGKLDEHGGPPLPGKYLAPKKYSNTTTSGLRFEVRKGSNSINLELTSDSEVSNVKSRSTGR